MTPDEVRNRFRADLQTRLPIHMARTRWDKERIIAHQRERLRHLLAHAKRHSRFHRRRLAGVRPETFELDQLPSLPIMTKAEMMLDFDEVVTDRRLTLEAVSRHVAAMGEFQMPLAEDYFTVSTGGSSGLKAVFVYDRSGMVDFMARLMAPGGPPSGGATVIGAIASPTAGHASGLAVSMGGGATRVVRAPVTLPIGDIVRRLNEAQPGLLYGYPSAILRLAGEQQSGRLRIHPSRITVGSEQLEPAAEHEITATFGAPILNVYGASEGLFGARPPGEEAFTIWTDLTIVELVDEHDQPVAPGTRSARILVTNLFNSVQPLIRYVIEDRFMRRPDAAGHGHLVATLEGRLAQRFVYGNTEVAALAVIAPMQAAPGVVDYQVRQTVDGVDVDVLARSGIDRLTLVADMKRALVHAGLQDASVSLRIVDHLDHDALTGKLRRVVPLEQPGIASRVF